MKRCHRAVQCDTKCSKFEFWPELDASSAIVDAKIKTETPPATAVKKEEPQDACEERPHHVIGTLDCHDFSSDEDTTKMAGSLPWKRRQKITMPAAKRHFRGFDRDIPLIRDAIFIPVPMIPSVPLHSSHPPEKPPPEAEPEPEKELKLEPESVLQKLGIPCLFEEDAAADQILEKWTKKRRFDEPSQALAWTYLPPASVQLPMTMSPPKILGPAPLTRRPQLYRPRQISRPRRKPQRRLVLPPNGVMVPHAMTRNVPFPVPPMPSPSTGLETAPSDAFMKLDSLQVSVEKTSSEAFPAPSFPEITSSPCPNPYPDLDFSKLRVQSPTKGPSQSSSSKALFPAPTTLVPQTSSPFPQPDFSGFKTQAPAFRGSFQSPPAKDPFAASSSLFPPPTPQGSPPRSYRDIYDRNRRELVTSRFKQANRSNGSYNQFTVGSRERLKAKRQNKTLFNMG